MRDADPDCMDRRAQKEVVHGNYKGIYYEDPAADQHYIDPSTGAHFAYRDMVKRLAQLSQARGAVSKTSQSIVVDRHVDLVPILAKSKKDSRSRSFDPRMPRALAKYMTFEAKKETELPRIRHAQLESEGILGLKKASHAAGLSLGKIRDSRQQRGLVVRSLNQRAQKERIVEDSSSASAMFGAPRAYAANRNSLMRNIMRDCKRSRNAQEGMKVRLCKLATEERRAIKAARQAGSFVHKYSAAAGIGADDNKH